MTEQNNNFSSSSKSDVLSRQESVPSIESVDQTKFSLKASLSQNADNWIAKNRSLVLRQTPLWAQGLIGILVSLGSIAVLGAIFFKIDEVITVQGQLVSLQGSIDVESPVSGKVAEVFFKDGQPVKKGDLLLRFDTRQALSQKETLEKSILIEKNERDNKLRILAETANILKLKINTSEQIISDLEKLVDAGGFQRMQFLQQRDQLFELKSQLSRVKLQETDVTLQANKSLEQLNNSLKQVQLQLQYQSVFSPVSGIIFQPKVGPDGVLSPNEVIVTIVPQGDFKAKIWVPNKDIGFVNPGLDAKVRVDAFPFTKYGELKGKVLKIGADALPPDQSQNYYRFPVELSLDKSYLSFKEKMIPLRNGMAVSANLKLREKRLISIVSDIFVEQGDSIKKIRQQ